MFTIQVETFGAGSATPGWLMTPDGDARIFATRDDADAIVARIVSERAAIYGSAPTPLVGVRYTVVDLATVSIDLALVETGAAAPAILHAACVQDDERGTDRVEWVTLTAAELIQQMAVPGDVVTVRPLCERCGRDLLAERTR